MRFIVEADSKTSASRSFALFKRRRAEINAGSIGCAAATVVMSFVPLLIRRLLAKQMIRGATVIAIGMDPIVCGRADDCDDSHMSAQEIE